MDLYKEHLAARVLHESRPITYKLLSRELKVHVHQAKQMLYYFHAIENQNRSGSVHATYIITGTKRPGPTTEVNGNADDDVPMRSSPIPSSLPDALADDEDSKSKVTSVKLVKEEDMEEIKAQFEEITSVHVYSLEPGPLKDLQVLSDCSREIAEKYSDEDPLKAWETYGSIRNPQASRRAPRIKPQAPAPVATTAAAKTAPRPSTTAVSKPKEVSTKGGDSQKVSRSPSPQVDAAALPKKKTDKASQKREASSIFASFAKAKPKKAAESGISTPATKSSEQSQAEDEPMKDASDEEGEEDEVAITGANEKSKEEAAEAMKKARAEREARDKKLRDMMDDDDDDDIAMQDAPVVAPEGPDETAEPIEDTLAQPEPEPEKKEEVTVSSGRRRGRRRVMKKRTYKDDDGYFVTKEEQVWESFSEDEPQPKKPKPTPAAAAKSKKGGGKQGQGSIMSFFAKKSS